MRPISAADAVSPTIRRTREFLFRSFTWGTYLKLGLVALITEGFAGNFFSSSHNGSHNGSWPEHAPTMHSHIGPVPLWIVALFMGLLAAFVLLVVFYLITRLRFAFFHCLIHNTKELRPGWRLYKMEATRFFWLNIMVGICFLLLVGLTAVPFIGGFLRLFHESQQGGQPDFSLLLSVVLPLIPLIALFALAAVLADLILRDCMLPHYALENATAGEAWTRVWARIKAEKKQFLVYAVLRIVLPTIAMVALFIVLFIPGLILAGSLALVELGLHSAFADATGTPAIIGVLVQVFFGVLGVGFLILATICLGSPVSTGIREYALIFYGSRYRTLGDILYPPFLQPQTARPQSPYPQR